MIAWIFSRKAGSTDGQFNPKQNCSLCGSVANFKQIWHPVMKTFISFDEALDLTLAHVAPGEAEILPLDQLTGKILAEDMVAKVDSPSVTTSRKDGYAVVSSDLAGATGENPVKLALVGHLSAGDMSDSTHYRWTGGSGHHRCSIAKGCRRRPIRRILRAVARYDSGSQYRRRRP